MTMLIDEPSNDNVQHINIVQDFSVVHKVSKRQRISYIDVDIVELVSSHEVCVSPGIDVGVVDSETNSSLNNVTNRSNCQSNYMNFLTRKSANTYIDETIMFSYILIQQVFLKLFFIFLIQAALYSFSYKFRNMLFK